MSCAIKVTVRTRGRKEMVWFLRETCVNISTQTTFPPNQSDPNPHLKPINKAIQAVNVPSAPWNYKGFTHPNI